MTAPTPALYPLLTAPPPPPPLLLAVRTRHDGGGMSDKPAVQLPLWIDIEAPPRSCPRCETVLRCVGYRDYGVFREWRYVGCDCYATQTIQENRAMKGKRHA